MQWVHNFEEALSSVKDHYEELQAKADNIVATPKQLEKYPDARNTSNYGGKKVYKFSNRMNTCLNSHTEYFFWSSSAYSCDKQVTQESLDKVLETFDEGVEDWKKDAELTRLTNVEIVGHNTLQVERVKSIMKTIGIRDQHSTFAYKTSRSRNKTESKHRAGYLDDLNRVVVTSDIVYDSMLRKFKELRDSIEKFGKTHIEETRKVQAEKQATAKAKEQVQQLAALRVKYTPDDYDSELDDILENLLAKNKYLMLAYWLEKNRGDWNDGYSYAERGLANFEVESTIDKEIEASIQSCIDDTEWGYDGRCFRDCNYNYSELYAMVEDDTLGKDLGILQEIMD